MAKPQRVWVLIQEHRHGTNVDVFATYEAAQNDLIEWAEVYWDELPKPRPEFTPDMGSVEYYFANHPDGETYSIEQKEVKQ